MLKMKYPLTDRCIALPNTDNREDIAAKKPLLSFSFGGLPISLPEIETLIHETIGIQRNCQVLVPSSSSNPNQTLTRDEREVHVQFIIYFLSFF